MKYGLFFLFLCISLGGFATVNTFNLSGYTFEFKEASYESAEGFNGNKINLYRIDSTGNRKQLLSHILKDYSGDCNSESLELGDYFVGDSTISFYSFWCNMGDAPVSPYGARLQVYKIDKNGKVKLQSSQLYIETSRMGWSENGGLEFLITQPVTPEETALLKRYIQQNETVYNARFVVGKQAENLIEKVKGKLKPIIEKETAHWDENVGFGMRL